MKFSKFYRDYLNACFSIKTPEKIGAVMVNGHEATYTFSIACEVAKELKTDVYDPETGEILFES